MKDLLKEAIADAKTVRETALANARLALEEAFTPRLQSMLSAKLAEEMSDDEDEYAEEPEEAMTDDTSTEASADEMPAKEETEEEPTEEGIDSEDDDDLDLDEIIRELENLDSSEAGAGEFDLYEDDEMSDEDGDEEGPWGSEEGPHLSEEEDEDIDINEIIRSLHEEDEEGEEDETMKEGEEMEDEKTEEDLKEAYNVIRFLKSKINEVNLLNAKLLYSNKLFRNFNLSEGQKMKVIENFDRTFTLREVKLVYSTLAEGFKMPSTKRIVKESFASKPIASTKPGKQVISEGAVLAARFQKLAGLKK